MAISFGGRAPTETLSNQESIANSTVRNGKIMRYWSKKCNKNSNKKKIVRYDCRKQLAD